MAIYIGTSGWVYKHWRGIFYPEDLKQRDWFSFYARHFDTVEINNSFYKLPSANTFDAWRDQAPTGFLYSVKASRFLTHMKKLNEPEDPLQKFFENASHLKEFFGPVLYQLPPNWRLNLPRFKHFLSILPEGHVHVVEFRDASWLVDEVFQLMQRYQVAHCIHDMHHLEIPTRVTAPQVYLRFHGDPSHAGDYQTETLEAWAKRISDWRRQDLDIFVYFNNDINGFALRNALSLKDMLE